MTPVFTSHPTRAGAIWMVESLSMVLTAANFSFAIRQKKGIIVVGRKRKFPSSSSSVVFSAMIGPFFCNSTGKNADLIRRVRDVSSPPPRSTERSSGVKTDVWTTPLLRGPDLALRGDKRLLRAQRDSPTGLFGQCGRVRRHRDLSVLRLLVSCSVSDNLVVFFYVSLAKYQVDELTPNSLPFHS